MIKDSLVYKFIIKFFDLLSKSSIVGYFTKDSRINIFDYFKHSLIYKLFNKFFCLLKRLIYKLKLDNYLYNSIFSNSLFWVCLLIVCVPLTSVEIITIISFFSILSLIFRSCVDDGFSLIRNNTNYFVVGFLFCIIVTAFMSVSGVSLLKAVVANVLLILNYFVALNSIRSIKDIKIVIKTFLIVGLLVCLYGLYQYFCDDSIMGAGWVDLTLFSNIDKRMTSTFNNPIFLGEYLIFYCIVCFGGFITSKKIKKFGLFICFCLAFVCLLLTYSRGCFLGLVFALIIMCVMLDKKNIVYLFMVFVLGFIFMPDNIMNRIFSIVNFSEGSNSYRIATWSGSINILKDFWLLGVGYGVSNFIRIFSYYSYTYFYINVEHAHNLILSIFCNYGLFGLLMFILTIISFYKSVISAFLKNQNNNKLKVLLLSLLCAVFGLLIVGIFDHVLHKFSIMLLFFLVLGVCIGITYLIKEGNDYE